MGIIWCVNRSTLGIDGGDDRERAGVVGEKRKVGERYQGGMKGKTVESFGGK